MLNDMNVGPPPVATSQRSPRFHPTSSSAPAANNPTLGAGNQWSNGQARPKSSKSINQYPPNHGLAAKQQSMDTSLDQNRSPNLNINRWSHSTSSSAGHVDADFLQQPSNDTISTRMMKPEPLSKMTAPPRSHFDAMRPNEATPTESLLKKSPNRSRNPQRGPPDAGRRYISEDAPGQDASFANTSEVDVSKSPANEPGYLRGTAVWDHSRGSNKYGQPFEGIALQYTTATSPRQKRPDNAKSGSGIYQATNSSHIGLQQKPARGRHRDRSANASKDTANGSSISSTRSDESRGRGHRSPTQKTMLSQALAKANQAVLLDNAQNIQGAIEAYVEACDILERVMYRSSDIEDRKKLAAIRSTYSTRIAELYDLDNTFEHLMTDKELPEEPFTAGYVDGEEQLSSPPLDHHTILLDSEEEELPADKVVIPLRQESLLPQIFGGDEYIGQQLPAHRHTASNSDSLNVPMDAQYMPSPLAPRRPQSPVENKDQLKPTGNLQPGNPHGTHKQRHVSSESISWLDTKDEATSESSSRFDSTEINREDLIGASFEADLDAVMNAAVNAAYDDEPAPEITPRPSEFGIMPRNVEDSHDLPNHVSESSIDARHNYLTNEPMSDEAEEEERLLDMVLENGIVFDEPKQGPNAMSSLPRTSDSSGFSTRSSGRTWESSVTTGTNATQLSTLAESPEMPQGSTFYNDSVRSTPNIQSSSEAETSRYKQVTSTPTVATAEKSLPLRDRRMSGQGSKQLKIETYVRRPSVPENAESSQAPAPLLEIPAQQKPVHSLTRSTSGTSNSVATQPLTPLPSVHSADSMSNSPATPGLTYMFSKSTLAEDDSGSATSDPRRLPSALRKNTSSSNLRPQNLSLSITESNEVPTTPGSAVFQHIPGFRTQSVLHTNLSNVNPNVLSSSANGGPYIFDPIAIPLSPTARPKSPDEARIDPLPLEQCPEAYLLRPFWVMRCLYQTLAHPKGGYLSTKLFVPRDIWRVKGVKIKAIDDKIGQCDVLTAALLRLSKVDTLDADAVLEELQQFDTIIETVRVALQKKLGSDVGVTGSVVNLKQTPGGEETETTSSKSTNSSVKSIASSWSRKLRSKSSSTALAPIISKREKDGSTDLTFPSVPMTSNSAPSTSRSYRSQRHPPPTPTGLPHIPSQNANYMSSLARLFDAVQVLDSIARQVEDPGLKATSTTHVGLELSIRGAAEFFSFFVIRFALADIGLFIDKYLKRNSEWAML